MKCITILLGAGILLLSSMVFAAVPQLINFQGILKDGSGNPVADGPYSVTFTIYDAASGGSNLWSETQSVNTVNGLFTVLLGAVTPVPDGAFNNPDRWLGVRVSLDPEMTPRQRLVSAAYSMRVAHFIPNYGIDNTFIGQNAGNLTAAGAQNTVCGVSAFALNTAGGGNTAMGYRALLSNTTGGNNNAMGLLALFNNTTGDNNTASGYGTLFSNTTGSNNTAIGYNANVSAGTLTNATAIGNGAVVNASNKIRLGNASVTVIEGQVAHTFPSDKNQKENFRPVDGGEVLRKIRGLELSSWNYKGHDPKQFRHYGPMAQDFFAAFGDDGVGKIGTETTLNSGDVAGILMIAVQALEKEKELMKTENAGLKSRIEHLEEVLIGVPAEKPQAKVWKK